MRKHIIFKGVEVYQSTFSEDSRGQIWTSWKFHEYPVTFNHDKFSISKKNVLRGLHGDDKTWKLISCVYGEFYLVFVDCRKDSPTYMKWDSITLSSTNHYQVLLPPMFANGHLVLSDECVFHYKLSYDGEYNDVENQFVIKWNDEKLNIKWPVNNPILYGRDNV